MKKTLVACLFTISMENPAIAKQAEEPSSEATPDDTYTFPDGTVVRTVQKSYSGIGSGTVIQIKPTNGKDCYGITGADKNAPSIACLSGNSSVTEGPGGPQYSYYICEPNVKYVVVVKPVESSSLFGSWV